MADYRRHEMVSGLFVALAIAVFVAFAFRIGGFNVNLFGHHGLVCRAYFSGVKTLDTRSKVSVAGRRVGQVTGIRLAELPATSGDPGRPGLEPGMTRHQIEVEFEITDQSLRLDPATAQVSLVQDGFLGRHYLELDAGYWPADADPLTVSDWTGGEPLRIEVVEGGGVDGLMNDGRALLQRMSSMLATIQSGFFDDESVTRGRRALADIEALLSADDPRGLHQTLVLPLRQLLDKAAPLVDEATGTMQSARGTIDEVRPSVVQVMADLQAATHEIDQRVAAIDEQLRGTLAEARGLLSENRAELAESIRRLRRTMWQAEMAMRKIRGNPSYLLFGDDAPDYEADPTDDAWLMRSSRARPYAQRDETNGK